WGGGAIAPSSRLSLRRYQPDQVRGVSRPGEISVPRGTPPASSTYIARGCHCQKMIRRPLHPQRGSERFVDCAQLQWLAESLARSISIGSPHNDRSLATSDRY